MGWRWAQVAGLQSQEGDLLCTADVWEVADELTDAAASPVDGNAGWISVAEASVSRDLPHASALARPAEPCRHAGLAGMGRSNGHVDVVRCRS